MTDDGNCVAATGQCTCKTHVQGRACDTCKDEFYALQAAKVDGCTACDCNLLGTNGSNVCNKATGQCPCLPSNTGRRCDQCAVGFYKAAASAVGQCTACHPQCANGCSGPTAAVTVCVACKNFQQADQCVATCTGFKYPDQNGVCQECNSECLGGCTGPSPTTADCTACKNFEYKGQCVSSCPAQTWSGPDHICRDCDPQCNGCFGSGPRNCTACRNANDGGVCVGQCPVNKYKETGGTCRSCSPLCDLSVGCTGPSSIECLHCATHTVVDPIAGFECRSSCPSLNYGSAELFNSRPTTLCRNCHPECAAACSGPANNNCIGGCVHFNYDGTCLASCPSHTYVDGGQCRDCHPACDSTRGCSGPASTQCDRCADTSVTFGGNQCLVACPAGFYADAARICQPCDPQCTHCTGPTASQCSRCVNLEYKGTCVASCNPISTFETVVLTPFIDGVDSPNATTNSTGSGALVSKRVCVDCNSQCFGGCSGPANTQCAACANVEFQGACLAACPAMTYRDSNKKCQPCDPLCKTGCSGPGPGPSTCTDCAIFRDGNTCVSACSIDAVGLNGTCVACHPQCSRIVNGCSGPSSAQCTACAAFRNTLDNTCVATCPFGTYPAGGECRPCHPQCNGCDGPLASQCDNCVNFLLDTVCVEECPLLTYASNPADICLDCADECLEDCIGPDDNQCVAINTTTGCAHKKSGTRCVLACDLTSEYEDGLFCRPCHAQCGLDGCTGPRSSDCLSCENVKFGANCVAACPNDHYVSSSRVCQPCNSECTSSSTNPKFCSGSGAELCTACLRAKDGIFCVSACNASTQFNDVGICKACDSQCDSQGCAGTGPTNCRGCRNRNNAGTCVATCPVDSTIPDPASNNCLACNAECNTVVGSGGCPGGVGASHCVQCLHVRHAGVCKATCPIGTYPDSSDVSTALGGVCRPCHSQCQSASGCTGGRADQCNNCANLIYGSTCVGSCPPRTVQVNTVCLDCDSNCLFGCTGTGPGDCTSSVPSALRANASDYGCKVVADVSPAGSAVCKSTCDLGKYRAASTSLCQGCDLTCVPALGCSGPGPTGCVPCPLDTYLNAPTRTCLPCSSQCKALGCSGPESEDCNACLHVRFNGDCVPDCTPYLNNHYLDTTSDPDENICRPCSPLCAPGGCDGPTASDCVAGCLNFVTPGGACVASCGSGSNTYESSSSPRTCSPCSPLCSGGCLGPQASQCLGCAHVKARNGTCLLECPANEERGTDNICVCPAASAYLSQGQCLPCHGECAKGCTGPLASQCSGGTDGCRHVFTAGACAATCGLNEVASGKICNCRPNHFRDSSGICQPCDAQCSAAGCTGAGPSACLECLNVRDNVVSGGAVVAVCKAVCPVGKAPNHLKVCSSCAAECKSGCTSPDDASTAVCNDCQNYADGGLCVDNCPDSKAFVDENDVGIVVCKLACPDARPFYKDTRNDDGVRVLPGLCAVSCKAFEAEGFDSVSSAFPRRCTTAERAAADTAAASSSGDSVSSTSIVLAAVLGGVALIVLVIVIVMLVRRKRGGKELGTSGAAGGGPPMRRRPSKISGVAMTDMGGGLAHRDSMIFDPFDGEPNYDNNASRLSAANASAYLDTSFLDSDTYMEVKTVGGGGGGGGAHYGHGFDPYGHVGNPYSMDDDALFAQPGIELDEVESTHM